MIDSSLSRRIRTFFFLLPGLVAAGSYARDAAAAPPSSTSAGGSISGVVSHRNNDGPVANAMVVVNCHCLSDPIETLSNARGVYSIRNLPAGTYTVQVVSGKEPVSRVVDLAPGGKMKSNFAVVPISEVRDVQVEDDGIADDTAGTKRIFEKKELQNNVMGDGPGRGFDGMVDGTATGKEGAGGMTIAGGTSSELKVTLNNQNVAAPGSNQVGAAMIVEFLQAVEIREAGYEAEFGGASTGQVAARRAQGTNIVSGRAGVRFSPRIARPRFITTTDESLRVQQVGDYRAEAYALVSGPLKKDRLFFTVGINPSGTQFSLIQSFYSRVDRDGSGGYEDCPYQNGDNDCVDGHNYIASKRFAQQRFRTGAISVGYLFGLDWVINSNHRLAATAQGGPSFTRTTFRLPFSFDPNAFGGNLAADPLSGASRVATGVVNEHFGWNLGQQHTVGLEYQGRALNGRMEIDAHVGYGQFETEDAWRLDDPTLKKKTATQFTDGQGSNLFALLDGDRALDLVPGVEEACNASGLPGQACPTRRWLSGGIGEYNHDIQRRVEGGVALTHFISPRRGGFHQLKYGGGVEWLQRRSIFRYSGDNGSDFYEAKADCDGQPGRGEYCYDEANEAYVIDNATRVDNHRFNLIDNDRPNDVQTRGFGVVRREQGELRALADALGRGVRADRYDETLSTWNYNLFVQDKWAVSDGLSLNVGARWEMQDMRDIYGDSAVLIWDNIAPRLGIVYDWTGEGRSRLYASYGWFYQPLPLALNSRVFGGLVQVGRTFDRSDCQQQATIVDGERKERMVDNQPTEWCVDNASFTTGLTKGGVVPRLRGQFNHQFQAGYEQEVVEDLVLGVRWLHTELGRAVEDVSTNGGLNFVIANPGVGVSEDDIEDKRAECDSLGAAYDEASALGLDSASELARERSQCEFLVDAFENVGSTFQRPTRNYDAWTVEVKKRVANNWMFVSSYTYSRLRGNYDGFVDPTTGAVNLGASTQYDIPELVRNSFGPLSSDQPHKLKLDGFYTFDFRKSGSLTLGTSFRFQSGYPINVRVDNNRYAGSYLIHALPRGAGGRIDPSYRVNLMTSYGYPFRSGKHDLRLEVVARLINVTNAKAVLRVDDVYSFQSGRPISGGDFEDLKHAKVQDQGSPNTFFDARIVTPQGNYGVETQFQTPLSAQFEVNLQF